MMCVWKFTLYYIIQEVCVKPINYTYASHPSFIVPRRRALNVYVNWHNRIIYMPIARLPFFHFFFIFFLPQEIFFFFFFFCFLSISFSKCYAIILLFSISQGSSSSPPSIKSPPLPPNPGFISFPFSLPYPLSPLRQPPYPVTILSFSSPT